MTTKYLDIFPTWHCKKAGGLLLGIRLHFPTSIYDTKAFASNHTYTSLRLTFGLIVCSINVDIKYNYKKTLPQ